jgi:Endonuclease I
MPCAPLIPTCRSSCSETSTPSTSRGAYLARGGWPAYEPVADAAGTCSPQLCVRRSGPGARQRPRLAGARRSAREFEPPEAHEGDLARAIFYFYTMYPKGARSIDDIAADGVGQFFTWHLQDPPDAKEIERNGRIESVQGNRNPYVDRPELVCRAYELPCGGS